MSADRAEGGDGPRAALAIEQTAAQLAGYAWVEQRLFEVLGGWAMNDGHPPAAVLFDVLSQQHAWHAQLFAERVPVVAHVEGLALGLGISRPPRAGLDGALERLASSHASAARLGALARVVLPRLVAGYRAHLGRTAPVADAPLVRALRLVVRDEVEALLECEQVLEALGGAVPVAELEALEQALSPGATAGPVGIVGWPPPGVSSRG